MFNGHVFGTSSKHENCFDNVKVSANAWDTNLVKVNPTFVALNWNAGGGGAFAVIPHKNAGKVPDNLPLYRAHTAPVLDTDFANFNDYVIASASEDTKVMIWNIPEELPDLSDLDKEIPDIQPVAKLSGHGRKVGHVLFHPTADNVLASSSADLTIKLWDIEKGSEKSELTGFTDFVQSLAWNWNGSLLATTSRDKKLRIFDVRANKVAIQADNHQGVKGARVVWLGDSDRIVTTGFSKMSDRQVWLWDTTTLGKPIKDFNIDTSSGIVMPFYDNDTKILFLAGKVIENNLDGNIRYYEFENDELYPLSEFKSSEPQRGMAFLPKRALNVTEVEIARAYKVTGNLIEPISFVLPRRSDAFQSDIYPPTVSDEPALTADEFFAGKNANPKTISLEYGFQSKEKKEFVSSAPKEEEKELQLPKTEKEYQEAYHTLRQENEDLRNQVAQRDVTIRALTAQLEQLKAAAS
ncbi:11183_t:CDS:2 [Ambispora gerdemannii]|uniref:Coronin n=1 Tax=Ambispora gerdemannii TaxID=144530 RepID=A0A9N8WCU8_9GLOM|nr:11183_t:CDS:2 [Ambispora gerdemannii]